MAPDINSIFKKIRYYLSFVMILLYLAFGLLILFSDYGIELLPNYRTPMGILFIAYGSYRFYIAYSKNEDADD